MSKWVSPIFKSPGFHCLNCHVYANQQWFVVRIDAGPQIETKEGKVGASLCSYCSQPTIWAAETIIYPTSGDFPPANPDLPDKIKKIYDEAGTIAQLSPRAACALLRLAVQLLLKSTGETGTINEGIRNLVKKGLDPKIQQDMDIVRVTGNHAVHPGEIEVDDVTRVQPLFQMINIISDFFFSQPSQVKELFEHLPDQDKNAISNRDKGVS